MLPFLTQGSRFYSTYASALSKSRNKAGVLLDLLFIFPMLLDRAAFCGCQKVGLSRDITSDCRSEVTRLGGLHEFLSVSKSFSGCPKPWFVIIFAFFEDKWCTDALRNARISKFSGLRICSLRNRSRIGFATLRQQIVELVLYTGTLNIQLCQRPSAI